VDAFRFGPEKLTDALLGYYSSSQCTVLGRSFVDAFRYQEQELYCEDVPLSELVEEFGTPLYVYSRNRMIENFRTLEAPLAERNIPSATR